MKKMRIIGIPVVIMIALAAAVAVMVMSDKQDDDEMHYISMLELIGNADKYDGKLVNVTGVGYIEFENQALYLTEADAEYSTGNSIWLEFDEGAITDEMLESNRKYVIVEGVFDKDNRGHMGAHSGTIEHVSRFDMTYTEYEKMKEESTETSSEEVE